MGDMTTAPQYRVYLEGPGPIEGAPEDVARVIASLVPASYPHVVVRIEYVVRDGRQVEGPYGIQVQQRPDATMEEWKPVGATLVRDLPFVKLERAARLVVTFGLQTPEGMPLNLSPGLLAATLPPPEEIPARAEEMVRTLHPDVDPDGGPGALRRWKRLIRLAEVQLEYNAAAAAGEKAPATVVAEKRGVAAGTVGTWLHHAKKEGLDVQLAPDLSVVALAEELELGPHPEDEPIEEKIAREARRMRRQNAYLAAEDDQSGVWVGGEFHPTDQAGDG